MEVIYHVKAEIVVLLDLEHYEITQTELLEPNIRMEDTIFMHMKNNGNMAKLMDPYESPGDCLNVKI